MSSLPEYGFLRLNQIIGDRKATPPIVPLIPVGRSTWWAGIKIGLFPAPVKLGPRTSVWRVADIRKLIEEPIISEHNHRNACKLIEMAPTAEGDAKRHAHLIAQGTTRDAKRDIKPRKGIQRKGTTVKKCTGRTA